MKPAAIISYGKAITASRGGTIRQGSRFAEGLAAGAGLILVLVAVFLFPRGRRSLTAVLRRMEDASRAGRSPWTGDPPSNYLDLYRAAGL